MKLVFFNNHKLSYDCQNNFNIETIVTDSNFLLNSFTVDLSGNAIYIINVNTIFDSYKYQDQAGVIIYRHLLHKFSTHQDKLKVVFMSVIKRHNLVKLKPENYVLNLFPFIEFNFDGTFFNKLIEELDYFVWPQLNNASENLLSGWSLAGQKKIVLNKDKKEDKKEKIKFKLIDDQASEWEWVYTSIFENLTLISTNKKISNKEVINNIISDEKINLDNANLIISDLYLTEAHINTWKDRSYIETISGYKILKIIRKQHALLPVIFLTSSNNINNYRGLNDLGIDGYTVKDNSILASTEQKLQNFREFEEAFKLPLLDNFNSVYLAEIYDHFNSNTEIQENIKQIIIQNLENVKYILSNNYDSKNQNSKTNSILENNCIINYGIAIESLYNTKKGKNFFEYLITDLRNYAAHKTNTGFIISDVIICSYLFYNFFNKNIKYKRFVSFSKLNHPYLSYLQLKNHIDKNNDIDEYIKELVEKKVIFYFSKFNNFKKNWNQKEKDDFINILNDKDNKESKELFPKI